MTKNKNELAIKKQNELALDISEEELALMAEDSDDFAYTPDSSDDLIMPRIKLLQAGTSICNKTTSEYIEGSEAGDIFDVSVKKNYKDSITFVPVKMIKTYLEFQGKGNSAKLINNYGTDPSVYMFHKNKKDENNKPIGLDDRGKVIGTKADSRIIEIYNIYSLIIDGANIISSVIPMSGSKVKVAKSLLTSIFNQVHPVTNKKLPFFARFYTLRSKPDTYNGEHYFNYDFKIGGLVLADKEKGKVIYEAAKEFSKFVNDSQDELSSKNIEEVDDKF